MSVFQSIYDCMDEKNYQKLNMLLQEPKDLYNYGIFTYKNEDFITIYNTTFTMDIGDLSD